MIGIWKGDRECKPRERHQDSMCQHDCKELNLSSAHPAGGGFIEDEPEDNKTVEKKRTIRIGNTFFFFNQSAIYSTGHRIHRRLGQVPLVMQGCLGIEESAQPDSSISTT